MRLRAALRSFNGMGARAYARQASALIDAPASPLPGLSAAQQAVVQLVAAGLSNRDIAKSLSMQSPSNVEQHLTRIYKELGLTRDRRRALRRLVNGLG